MTEPHEHKYCYLAQRPISENSCCLCHPHEGCELNERGKKLLFAVHDEVKNDAFGKPAEHGWEMRFDEILHSRTHGRLDRLYHEPDRMLTEGYDLEQFREQLKIFIREALREADEIAFMRGYKQAERDARADEMITKVEKH